MAESPMFASTAVSTPTHLVKKKVTEEWDESMVPAYLDDTYWWAYTRPWAVRIFERKWLVNSILWGNFELLRDAALDEIHHQQIQAASTNDCPQAQSVLQIACVYGEFSEKLLSLLRPHDALTIVDVAPSQLENVSRKLSLEDNQFLDETHRPRVNVLQQDSSDMDQLQDGSQDTVFLFFLLHEQPEHVRRKTLKEAIRVLKPYTGKLVIVDYHKPSSAWNPFRYIMEPVFCLLEPFAMDLWRHSITHYIQDDNIKVTSSKLYFGGLYQKLVIEKEG